MYNRESAVTKKKKGPEERVDSGEWSGLGDKREIKKRGERGVKLDSIPASV